MPSEEATVTLHVRERPLRPATTERWYHTPVTVVFLVLILGLAAMVALDFAGVIDLAGMNKPPAKPEYTVLVCRSFTIETGRDQAIVRCFR